MPLKHIDPFTNLVKELNPAINPYVAILAAGIEKGDFPVACGEMLKQFPGNWRQKIAAFYQRDIPFKKLVVEIGCHKGHVLCKMAAANPDIAFIGIDITYKRVVGAAERAQKSGLKNVYTVLANAKCIDLLFKSSELDGALIFFPDPWIKKKRQAKNRLVDAEFAQKLHPLLNNNSFLWFKTDQKSYFDLAEQAFSDSGYVTQNQPCEITGTEYTSMFEQKFSEQNLPTYGSKWLRSSQKDELAN